MGYLVEDQIARATLDSWDLLAGQELMKSTTWLSGMEDLISAPAGKIVGPTDAEFVLVVPSSLEQTALEVVAADFAANGATNVAKGKAGLIISEELDAIDATRWYLIRGGLGMILRPPSPDYHYLITSTGSEVKEVKEGKEADIESPEAFQLKGSIPRYAPNTVSLDRRRLRSDQLGMARAQISEMVGRIAGHLPLLAARALDGGRGDVGYDTKATFADDHYIDVTNKKGAQDNNLALALSVNNFFAAKKQLRSFVARDKQPFGRSMLPFLMLLINESPEPFEVGPGDESYKTTKQIKYGISVSWAVRLGRWWQAVTSKP